MMRARAVADALAAFEVLADRRVRLPALHLLERAQPRVAVVEADDEAERRPGCRRGGRGRRRRRSPVHRPAGGVHDEARLVPRRLDLPQLLDADAVALRIAAGIELEARDQLLAEVAARAFGEDRVLAVQLHAELEVVGRLAVLADAQVAGGDADDRAVVVVQHLGGGEAGEDLDAQRLGLLRQPAHDVAEADDVVAVVVEAVGQEEIAACASRRSR